MTATATAPNATESFLAAWADVSAIGAALSVLGWDQQTNMPPKGATARDHALSVLAGIQHDKLTDPALTEAIDRAESSAPDDATLALQIREARRDIRRVYNGG